MPTKRTLVKTDLTAHLANLYSMAPFYGYRTTPPARVRAMAPAGATYPRAAVVRQDSSKWTISIKHSADHWYGDYILDDEGKPLAFELHRGALTHAAHSINALRARRHPAGQSWLRGSQ